MTFSEDFVRAYLRRLGVDSAGPADLTLLRELHAAHLRRIPFENISIHLGEPLSLEPAELTDKILVRGRGGFCYELNGLFALLLSELDYRVSLLGARVWDGQTFGPPLDHLVLAVGMADADERWAVDVGFGDHSVYPLPWKDSVDHDDPDGVFRFERADDGDWDLYRNAAVQYRIEQHPRVLSEFDAMCWYHQTSPNSPFTRSTVCSRRTDEGRVTLSGRRLITTTADGKHEEEIAEDDLLLATYTTVFGIELERLPSAPLPNPNPPW